MPVLKQSVTSGTEPQDFDVPPIVSADDHVFEPPDLWEGRLPARYADRAPRVEKKRISFLKNSKGRQWMECSDGEECDAWVWEDLTAPLNALLGAVGMTDPDVQAIKYEDLHLGTWNQSARLSDMDSNNVEASLCFPNLFRFAGQAFSERGDKDLSLACLRAYNDWLIDEWGGGAGKGRLLAVTPVPLWDPDLAADEVHRCAAKGSFLVTFPENPYPLGLPSIYSDHWDPFFNACQDVGAVVNMHIGSSSRMLPHPTPEAPYIVNSVQTFVNTQASLLDFIFSNTLTRFPTLRISYAESQIGWLPYVLERADALWSERTDNDFGHNLLEPPSSFVHGRISFCIFDDSVGLRNRDVVGMDHILYETDYPHADSPFPYTVETFDRISRAANLTPEERFKLARGNAISNFGLDRYGIL